MDCWGAAFRAEGCFVHPLEGPAVGPVLMPARIPSLQVVISGWGCPALRRLLSGWVEEMMFLVMKEIANGR